MRGRDAAVREQWMGGQGREVQKGVDEEDRVGGGGR